MEIPLTVRSVFGRSRMCYSAEECRLEVSHKEIAMVILLVNLQTAVLLVFIAE